MVVKVKWEKFQDRQLLEHDVKIRQRRPPTDQQILLCREYTKSSAHSVKQKLAPT